MRLSKRFNVLDTETTGFSPKNGDRIVEIGIVELVNWKKTKRNFHKYINPEGKLVGDSIDIHGLSDNFLSKQQTFSEIYDSFANFIGFDPLVIHNASFDLRFLAAEIDMVEGELLENEIFDTLKIARERKLGIKNNKLNTLCHQFGIDTSHRKTHGALTDAGLLADLFVRMMRA